MPTERATSQPRSLRGERRAGRPPVRDDLRLEIAGVVLAAVGVWLYISMAGGGGFLGGKVRAGLVFLVGTVTGWVLPGALLAIGGSLLIFRKIAAVPPWRVWGGLLLFLTLVTVVQVLRYPLLPAEAVELADAGKVAYFFDPQSKALAWENLSRGGGALGWAVEWLLTKLLGHAGRWVVLVAAFLVGTVLAFEISIGQILNRAGSQAVRAGGALASGALARGAGRLAGHAGRLSTGREGAGARPEGLRPDAVSTVVGRREQGSQEQGSQEPGFTIRIAGQESAGAAGGRGAAATGATLTGLGSGAATGANPAGLGSGAATGAAPVAGVGAALLPGAGGGSPAAPGSGTGGRSGATGATGAAAGGGTAPGMAGAKESGVAPAAGHPSAGATTAGAPVGGPEQGRGKKAGAGGGGDAAGVRLTRRGEQWQMALETEAAAVPAPYRMPPVELLKTGGGPAAPGRDSHQAIVDRARLLEEVLGTYGVPAKVIEVHQGPAITRFELTLQPGVKVGKVASLADDLAYHLAARDVRIEAPIPGKRAIGIEVPNQEVVAVHLRDVIESAEWQQHGSKLAVAFGKDIAGKPIVGDLEKMPHLLIAGATGSGKSVCMNGIICSLLMRAGPDEVKMLMVDPKRVELSVYDGIPHLVAPVVTDPRKAAGYLKWAVKEMEARYDLLAASGTRNITSYNKWVEEQNAAILAQRKGRPAPADGDGEDEAGEEELALKQPLPYIVIFLDELSDLMMVAPVEVEDSIIRLAQMARACGIHLVIATQRPSVDVITGLIKANIPSRIAFAVSSAVESRIILDGSGAEKLLGKGDMLYHPQGLSKPVRAQGAFVSDREVEALVTFVKRQGEPTYQAEAMAVEGTGAKGGRTGGEAAGGNGGGGGKESALDAVFPEAVRVVIEHGQASVSILQRRLRCNYTKATRLIDMMEERGFIGPHQGPKPRDVLITMPQWQALFGDEEGAGSEENGGEGEEPW